MAVDKLVDSVQLDADLTSVADAIRAKTGGTAKLAFPADFVSEIGSISGGGGAGIISSDNYDFVFGIVTVGANTVSRVPQVETYLLGLLGETPAGTLVSIRWGIVDWDGTTVNNLAFCTDQNSSNFYRFRNGSFASVPISQNYDAVIRSGDKYLIAAIYWKGGPTV